MLENGRAEELALLVNNGFSPFAFSQVAPQQVNEGGNHKHGHRIANQAARERDIIITRRALHAGVTDLAFDSHHLGHVLAEIVHLDFAAIE